jgi:hypothetical protein
VKLGLTLQGKDRDKVLRRIFGPKGEEIIQTSKNKNKMCFTIHILELILLRRLNRKERNGGLVIHVRKPPEGEDNLEDLDVDSREIIKLET